MIAHSQQHPSARSDLLVPPSQRDPHRDASAGSLARLLPPFPPHLFTPRHFSMPLHSHFKEIIATRSASQRSSSSLFAFYTSQVHPPQRERRAASCSSLLTCSLLWQPPRHPSAADCRSSPSSHVCCALTCMSLAVAVTNSLCFSTSEQSRAAQRIPMLCIASRRTMHVVSRSANGPSLDLSGWVQRCRSTTHASSHPILARARLSCNALQFQSSKRDTKNLSTLGTGR